MHEQTRTNTHQRRPVVVVVPRPLIVTAVVTAVADANAQVPAAVARDEGFSAAAKFAVAVAVQGYVLL
jgi:hypothetical protein